MLASLAPTWARLAVLNIPRVARLLGARRTAERSQASSAAVFSECEVARINENYVKDANYAGTRNVRSALLNLFVSCTK